MTDLCILNYIFCSEHIFLKYQSVAGKSFPISFALFREIQKGFRFLYHISITSEINNFPKIKGA